MSTRLEAEAGVGSGYDVCLASEICFGDGEGDEEVGEDSRSDAVSS